MTMHLLPEEARRLEEIVQMVSAPLFKKIRATWSSKVEEETLQTVLTELHDILLHSVIGEKTFPVACGCQGIEEGTDAALFMEDVGHLICAFWQDDKAEPEKLTARLGALGYSELATRIRNLTLQGKMLYLVGKKGLRQLTLSWFQKQSGASKRGGTSHADPL